MRESLVAALACCLFVGCESSGNADRPAIIVLEKADLLGTWNHTSELDGRLVPLWIDSTYATFDSVGDTLFRYTYRVRGDSLKLTDVAGNGGWIQVEKLSVDSLILEGKLRPLKGVERFWRNDAP